MAYQTQLTVYSQLFALRDRQRAAIYVIEGKGYTVVEGQRQDWESGDLVLLPIQPGGVEHQHFNLNGDTPSRWMAYIYKPFHDEVAHGMEQREESPEFQGSDC